MWGFLSALFLGGKLAKDALEPTLPAEYHGNHQLENEDVQKVMLGQMSKREYLRNMENGKYYKAPVQSDFNATIVWSNLCLRKDDCLNLKCECGCANFVKKMSPEKAKEIYWGAVREGISTINPSEAELKRLFAKFNIDWTDNN